MADETQPLNLEDLPQRLRTLLHHRHRPPLHPPRRERSSLSSASSTSSSPSTDDDHNHNMPLTLGVLESPAFLLDEDDKNNNEKYKQYKGNHNEKEKKMHALASPSPSSADALTDEASEQRGSKRRKRERKRERERERDTKAEGNSAASRSSSRRSTSSHSPYRNRDSTHGSRRSRSRSGSPPARDTAVLPHSPHYSSSTHSVLVPPASTPLALPTRSHSDNNRRGRSHENIAPLDTGELHKMEMDQERDHHHHHHHHDDHHLVEHDHNRKLDTSSVLALPSSSTTSSSRDEERPPRDAPSDTGREQGQAPRTASPAAAAEEERNRNRAAPSRPMVEGADFHMDEEPESVPPRYSLIGGTPDSMLVAAPPLTTGPPPPAPAPSSLARPLPSRPEEDDEEEKEVNTKEEQRHDGRGAVASDERARPPSHTRFLADMELQMGGGEVEDEALAEEFGETLCVQDLPFTNETNEEDLAIPLIGLHPVEKPPTTSTTTASASVVAAMQGAVKPRIQRDIDSTDAPKHHQEAVAPPPDELPETADDGCPKEDFMLLWATAPAPPNLQPTTTTTTTTGTTNALPSPTRIAGDGVQHHSAPNASSLPHQEPSHHRKEQLEVDALPAEDDKESPMLLPTPMGPDTLEQCRPFLQLHADSPPQDPLLSPPSTLPPPPPQGLCDLAADANEEEGVAVPPNLPSRQANVLDAEGGPDPDPQQGWRSTRRALHPVDEERNGLRPSRSPLPPHGRTEGGRGMATSGDHRESHFAPGAARRPHGFALKPSASPVESSLSAKPNVAQRSDKAKALAPMMSPAETILSNPTVHQSNAASGLTSAHDTVTSPLSRAARQEEEPAPTIQFSSTTTTTTSSMSHPKKPRGVKQAEDEMDHRPSSSTRASRASNSNRNTNSNSKHHPTTTTKAAKTTPPPAVLKVGMAVEGRWGRTWFPAVVTENQKGAYVQIRWLADQSLLHVKVKDVRLVPAAENHHHNNNSNNTTTTTMEGTTSTTRTKNEEEEKKPHKKVLEDDDGEEEERAALNTIIAADTTAMATTPTSAVSRGFTAMVGGAPNHTKSQPGDGVDPLEPEREDYQKSPLVKRLLLSEDVLEPKKEKEEEEEEEHDEEVQRQQQQPDQRATIASGKETPRGPNPTMATTSTTMTTPAAQASDSPVSVRREEECCTPYQQQQQRSPQAEKNDPTTNVASMPMSTLFHCLHASSTTRAFVTWWQRHFFFDNPQPIYCYLTEMARLEMEGSESLSRRFVHFLWKDTVAQFVRSQQEEEMVMAKRRDAERKRHRGGRGISNTGSKRRRKDQEQSRSRSSSSSFSDVEGLADDDDLEADEVDEDDEESYLLMASRFFSISAALARRPPRIHWLTSPHELAALDDRVTLFYFVSAGEYRRRAVLQPSSTSPGHRGSLGNGSTGFTTTTTRTHINATTTQMPVPNKREEEEVQGGGEGGDRQGKPVSVVSLARGETAQQKGKAHQEDQGEEEDQDPGITPDSMPVFTLAFCLGVTPISIQELFTLYPLDREEKDTTTAGADDDDDDDGGDHDNDDEEDQIHQEQCRTRDGNHKIQKDGAKKEDVDEGSVHHHGTMMMLNQGRNDALMLSPAAPSGHEPASFSLLGKVFPPIWMRWPSALPQPRYSSLPFHSVLSLSSAAMTIPLDFSPSSTKSSPFPHNRDYPSASHNNNNNNNNTNNSNNNNEGSCAASDHSSWYHRVPRQLLVERKKDPHDTPHPSPLTPHKQYHTISNTPTTTTSSGRCSSVFLCGSAPRGWGGLLGQEARPGPTAITGGPGISTTPNATEPRASASVQKTSGVLPSSISPISARSTGLLSFGVMEGTAAAVAAAGDLASTGTSSRYTDDATTRSSGRDDYYSHLVDFTHLCRYHPLPSALRLLGTERVAVLPRTTAPIATTSTATRKHMNHERPSARDAYVALVVRHCGGRCVPFHGEDVQAYTTGTSTTSRVSHQEHQTRSSKDLRKSPEKCEEGQQSPCCFSSPFAFYYAPPHQTVVVHSQLCSTPLLESRWLRAKLMEHYFAFTQVELYLIQYLFLTQQAPVVNPPLLPQELCGGTGNGNRAANEEAVALSTAQIAPKRLLAAANSTPRIGEWLIAVQRAFEAHCQLQEDSEAKQTPEMARAPQPNKESANTDGEHMNPTTEPTVKKERREFQSGRGPCDSAGSPGGERPLFFSVPSLGAPQWTQQLLRYMERYRRRRRRRSVPEYLPRSGSTKPLFTATTMATAAAFPSGSLAPPGPDGRGALLHHRTGGFRGDDDVLLQREPPPPPPLLADQKRLRSKKRPREREADALPHPTDHREDDARLESSIPSPSHHHHRGRDRGDISHHRQRKGLLDGPTATTMNFSSSPPEQDPSRTPVMVDEGISGERRRRRHRRQSRRRSSSGSALGSDSSASVVLGTIPLPPPAEGLVEDTRGSAAPPTSSSFPFTFTISQCRPSDGLDPTTTTAVHATTANTEGGGRGGWTSSTQLVAAAKERMLVGGEGSTFDTQQEKERGDIESGEDWMVRCDSMPVIPPLPQLQLSGTTAALGTATPTGISGNGDADEEEAHAPRAHASRAGMPFDYHPPIRLNHQPLPNLVPPPPLPPNPHSTNPTNSVNWSISSATSANNENYHMQIALGEDYYVQLLPTTRMTNPTMARGAAEGASDEVAIHPITTSTMDTTAAAAAPSLASTSLLHRYYPPTSMPTFMMNEDNPNLLGNAPRVQPILRLGRVIRVDQPAAAAEGPAPPPPPPLMVTLALYEVQQCVCQQLSVPRPSPHSHDAEALFSSMDPTASRLGPPNAPLPSSSSMTSERRVYMQHIVGLSRTEIVQVPASQLLFDVPVYVVSLSALPHVYILNE